MQWTGVIPIGKNGEADISLAWNTTTTVDPNL